MGFRIHGRSPFLILAFGAMGAGIGLYSQTPPAPRAHTPLTTTETGTAKLKLLVEAAEKAVRSEDWSTAEARADEADDVVESLSEGILSKPEEQALLERLSAVRKVLDEENPAGPEDGIRMATEAVSLSGDDLKAQLAQVQAAEQGAVFDFPIDLNDKVLSWVYNFTHGLRGFMEGSLSRGTQYLPMARQIFQEEGVPQDLAYLALIESGFKNTARSTAKAVGMWQFIRSTGRLFGLDGNAWVEERRDPVKACRASARYLRHLYEASGDWYLAVAGYNAGPLTLDRAAGGLGTFNFWDMARSGYLRNETKDYVPKLLAAILVGRFPERYGLSVVQMTPYAYETVDVDRMTSLGVLARFAGTNVDELKELNPELLRDTTPPGRYTLRVPPGTSGDTYRALASIPAGQRLDFQTYVIRKRDTLAKVAAHFDVSPADLLATNGMTKAQFRVGRRIQVPPAAPIAIDQRDLKPLSLREQEIVERPLQELPTIPSRPTPDAPAAGPASARELSRPPAVPSRPVRTAELPAKPSSHTVKRGETLFSIAERYGINVSDLTRWNKIRRNRITVGQVLKLRKP